MCCVKLFRSIVQRQLISVSVMSSRKFGQQSSTKSTHLWWGNPFLIQGERCLITNFALHQGATAALCEPLTPQTNLLVYHFSTLKTKRGEHWWCLARPQVVRAKSGRRAERCEHCWHPAECQRSSSVSVFCEEWATTLTFTKFLECEWEHGVLHSQRVLRFWMSKCGLMDP